MEIKINYANSIDGMEFIYSYELNSEARFNSG